MSNLLNLSLALDRAIKDIEKYPGSVTRLALEVLRERKEYVDSVIKAASLLPLQRN